MNRREVRRRPVLSARIASTVDVVIIPFGPETPGAGPRPDRFPQSLGVLEMFGSVVLETAIGLVFVYLIFSLIASGIAEYLSALLDRRSEHLKHMLFNIFDSDDPQGRALLNLFVAHPMIRALSTTAWKPKYQSAIERLGEAKLQVDRAGIQWEAASKAVAAAGAARDAAKGADAAAARLKAALKAFNPADPAHVQALQEAIAGTEATANAADLATAAANVAEQQVKDTRSNGVNPPSSGPAANTPTTPPRPAADDPRVQANSAVEHATAAAKAARTAADAAEKAKRGLDSDLIGLVTVPRYIPDRTFVDALVHILTAEDTIRALKPDAGAIVQAGDPAAGLSPPFWDQYGAALKVVGGVASRLDEGEAKANLLRSIATIEGSVQLAAAGAVAAAAFVGQAEKETNELRAAIAAVRDDSLRAALEREVDASLRPLQAASQDILALHRAGRTIAMMADSSIKTALSAFLAQAGEDMDAFRQNVANWFNDVMDHTSGWYKRNTQLILMAIAVILCTFNNVDTIALVDHLSTDPAARAAAAKEASAFLATSGPAPVTAVAGNVPVESRRPAADPRQVALQYRSSLDATKLPLWWTWSEWNHLWYALDGAAPNAEARGANAPSADPASTGPTPAPVPRISPNSTWIIAKFTGLLLSIMAVSMGAPFWFDVLNKLVNIRLASGRPDPTATDLAPAAAPANARSDARSSPDRAATPAAR